MLTEIGKLLVGAFSHDFAATSAFEQPSRSLAAINSGQEYLGVGGMASQLLEPRRPHIGK